MGDLLGNAVRFGVADDDVLVAGEGIEIMLSLRCVLPTLPLASIGDTWPECPPNR
ncbi:MAG TPA: hypothetical protein VG274_12160 [Rhizomicrobium sp.]|nr:hypothetical protein [Rhizomicrobium sp.]